MVVTDLEGVYAEDPADHGVVEVNRLGRVTAFAYKPDRPASSTVATEVFVYEPDVLLEVLEELHHEQSDEPHEGDDDVGDSGLGDFGDLLLPRFVDRGRPSPTGSTATGATSASRTTTSTPTSSWCAGRATSSRPTGRSGPSSHSASRRTSSRRAWSRTACSARAAASAAPCGAACSRPAWWSRRAPRWSRA